MPDAAVQLHPLRAIGHALRIALLGVFLTACAAPEPFVAPRPDVPRKAGVTGVPLIVQADFHCGPASLAMVLQWAGREVTQAEIAALSFTPGARGTYLADMAGAARRQGQMALPVRTFAGLLEEVEAGHPVIVFQNLGLRLAPLWHYGVVTGYDLNRGEITLHSGENSVMVMTLDDFLKSWDGGDRWAMVVLPPDRHPARVDEIALLRAAAALESAGQAEAASRAYRSGGERWPGNWLWPFGLGNALYSQGRLVEARRAFQRAVTLDPSAEAARNNLAQVTSELGA